MLLILAHFMHAFSVILRNSQHAVEIDFCRRLLQQASALKLFDVGKIAQAGQSEHLHEFPRSDIGEGGTGFRRARTCGDEVEALEAANDVAADFLANQPRQFSAGGGLQIGDGGDGVTLT
jgi:hypothetical protein